MLATWASIRALSPGRPRILGPSEFPEGRHRVVRRHHHGQPHLRAEIQTPEFGFGLDGLLRARADKLTGILNGVDYDEWNPEHDPYLPAHYSAADLSGKPLANSRCSRRWVCRSIGNVR